MMTTNKQTTSTTSSDVIRGWLRRNRIFSRFWWWCHVRFPRLVPSLHSRRVSSYMERDIGDNEKTSIPLEEEMRVLCIWCTEVYGPSEIDTLYTGLEKLDWHRDRFHGHQSGCIDWIKRQRQFGSEGTFNLGIISRRGETRYLGMNYFADLPNGVDYLIAEVHQLCPSLTCVQIAFVLDATHQKLYAEELQIDRPTTHEPIRDRFCSYRIMDPYHHKRRAIESRRCELQTLSVQWFRKNLPGLFCSTPLVGYPPTAELITTQRASILEDSRHAGNSMKSWPRLMANSFIHNAWRSTEYSSLLFAPQDSDSEEKSHILISLRTSDLPAAAVEPFGGYQPSAYTSFIHERVNGILISFAAISLLNALRRILIQTRDQLKVASPRKRRVLESLDYIQKFFSASLQVPSIVGELAEKARNEHSYRWSCEGFIEAVAFRGEPPAKFDERIRAHTMHLATRLLNDDKTTRESLKQISEVVTARESVKAQRRMEILTVVAIAVAALSLWIALPPVDKWRSGLRDLTNRIAGEPLATDSAPVPPVAPLVHKKATPPKTPKPSLQEGLRVKAAQHP